MEYVSNSLNFLTSYTLNSWPVKKVLLYRFPLKLIPDWMDLMHPNSMYDSALITQSGDEMPEASPP